MLTKFSKIKNVNNKCSKWIDYLFIRLSFSSNKIKVIQCEKDMKNLQEALTKIKKEERRKKKELEKKQVRLNCLSFSGKVAIIGQCIITSHISFFYFIKRLNSRNMKWTVKFVIN